MSRRVLALLLLLAAAARAADAPGPAVTYRELPPGRYSLEIRGMICTVCARAIAAEWAKMPEIAKASADYHAESGVVDVRLDRTLQVSALRRALRRAEKVSNLGARFSLAEIRYIP
jgi:Heavy-metal-associated domain